MESLDKTEVGSEHEMIDIRRCRRCGHDHVFLPLRKLGNPIQCNNKMLTHWTICPTTGEPILIAYIGA